ncbi:MAG TPA: hypothetical protein VMT45_13795 [Thermoanaerobaculaceae bacterium]|nr:hypothetical protein [Thermoanaerobaculaceae bacterium]
MPTDIRIVHAHEFVKVTAEGQIDSGETKRMLVECASASAPPTQYDMVLDTRRAHVRLSATEVWYLAAELSNLPKPTPRRTAVLCPLKDFDTAAFFALCAQNRGLRIEAFTSFEDAMEWLVANGT